MKDYRIAYEILADYFWDGVDDDARMEAAKALAEAGMKNFVPVDFVLTWQERAFEALEDL